MKKKSFRSALVLLAAVVSIALVASAQPQPTSTTTALSPEQLQVLARIRDAALEDDYAYREIAHLSENIGPRPSGSPQAAKAVEYVAAELKRLGLEVTLEPVKVPHWVRGAEAAQLVEYPGQAEGVPQKIVVTALGGSTSTPDSGLTADVVVVSSYDELKALGREKVAGKIVLFTAAFDKQKAAAGYAMDAYGEAVDYRSTGAKAAASLGAAASLIRSVGGADFRIPHTGWSQPAGIPAGAVASEDADLIAHLAAQGKVRMVLTLTPQQLPDTSSYNVVADLKGSEHPEQIVVVSGHLDSWDLGTGALDDAAGVAVAMETAQLLTELKVRPRRTLRVIAWMDEENGGRGRDAYTSDHASEFANHIAVMESDLGADHPLGFATKLTPAALVLLGPVSKVLGSFGASAVRNSNSSPGADISAMAKAGVPALGILQDSRRYFNYHHSAADTLDKINPRELRENAAAMAVMGFALADMAQPLPR
jgi:Zn-dependent M28 family amino/carboxypeptidase